VLAGVATAPTGGVVDNRARTGAPADLSLIECDAVYSVYPGNRVHSNCAHEQMGRAVPAVWSVGGQLASRAETYQRARR